MVTWSIHAHDGSSSRTRPSPRDVSRSIYGEKHALKSVSVDIPERGHGLDRSVWLRQIDLPALPQPDERH